MKHLTLITLITLITPITLITLIDQLVSLINIYIHSYDNPDNSNRPLSSGRDVYIYIYI